MLVRSFSVAAAEGLTAALRETVAAIGEQEAITRAELGERLGRGRSTISYRVMRARQRELLDEQKIAGKRLLRRDRPLPEERLPLPDVEEVEGFFFGVPAPPRTLCRRRSECFDAFIHAFSQVGPRGVTAAKWAARVGQRVTVVRQRLHALVRAGPLTYKRKTKRYAVRK